MASFIFPELVQWEELFYAEVRLTSWPLISFLWSWLVMGKGLVIPFDNSRGSISPLTSYCPCGPQLSLHSWETLWALLLTSLRGMLLGLVKIPLGGKGQTQEVHAKYNSRNNGTGGDPRTEHHNVSKNLVTHSETCLSFWIHTSQGLVSKPTAAFHLKLTLICLAVLAVARPKRKESFSLFLLLQFHQGPFVIFPQTEASLWIIVS